MARTRNPRVRSHHVSEENLLSRRVAKLEEQVTAYAFVDYCEAHEAEWKARDAEYRRTQQQWAAAHPQRFTYHQDGRELSEADASISIPMEEPSCRPCQSAPFKDMPIGTPAPNLMVVRDVR